MRSADRRADLLGAGFRNVTASYGAGGYFNQQWARGGKIDFVQLAMDSFGNALGNHLVDSMAPRASAPKPAQQQAQNDDPFDLKGNFSRGIGEGLDQQEYSVSDTPDTTNAKGWDGSQLRQTTAQLMSFLGADQPPVASLDLSPRQLAYAKDTLKLVGGFGTAITGLAIGVTGAGAPIGGSLLVIGVNEGGDALASIYNRATGGDDNNFNLMERSLVNYLGDDGVVAYRGFSFAANAISLGARVPLAGFADGINGGKSIFGVTVARWNSPKNIPLTQIKQPEVVVKSSLTYEVASKGNDLYESMREKK